MVKVTFLDYGAGNIRSLRNALIKVCAPTCSPSLPPTRVRTCTIAVPAPVVCARHQLALFHLYRRAGGRVFIRPRAKLIHPWAMAGWV
jgi:hypothetical protein